MTKHNDVETFLFLMACEKPERDRRFYKKTGKGKRLVNLDCLVCYPPGSRVDAEGNPIMKRHAELLSVAQLFLSVDATMADYKDATVTGHTQGETFTGDAFMK